MIAKIWCLSLVTFLCICSVVSHASHELSDYWKEYLRLEQECQVWFRHDNYYHYRGAIVFYEYWQPQEKFTVSATPGAELLQTFTPKQGFYRVLVPSTSTNGHHECDFYQELNKKLGMHRKKWIGYRIVGHASYLLFPTEESQGEGPLLIKVEVPGEKDDLGRYFNSEDSARQAVATNTHLEQLQREYPELNVNFWPEPLAFIYHDKEISYTFSLRQLPPRHLWKKRSLRLFPTNGFLGSNWPEELAGSYSKKKDWLKSHYGPKLAHLFVNVFFKAGVWPALHTQNSSVVVDTHRKTLQEIIFKDLSDTLVHPLIQILQGVYVPYSRDDRPSILGVDIVEGTDVAIYPEYFLLNYFSQSLKYFNPGFGADRDFENYYLFFKTVMELLSIRPSDLTVAGKKALVTLQKNFSIEEDLNFTVPRSIYKILIYKKQAPRYVSIFKIFLQLMHEIYKINLHRMLVARLSAEENELLPPQDRLLVKFSKAAEREQVQWAYPDYKTQYKDLMAMGQVSYLFTAHGVLAYDHKNLQPLGLELSRIIKRPLSCEERL